MSTDATPETQPVRKFMFDLSFNDAKDVHRAPERKPVLMKPEQIDALKKEHYDLGFSDGMKARQETQTAEQNALLGQIDARIALLTDNLAAIVAEQTDYTRQLALAISKKILPAFVEKSGTQEIEALIDETLSTMSREPRLVVRVAENNFEALNARIQEIATQRAYSGKVIILADNDVAAGDCRIEWADGGVERNTAATTDAIEQTLLPSS